MSGGSSAKGIEAEAWDLSLFAESDSEMLGSGHFGKVYLYKNGTDEFAVKRVEINRPSGTDFTNEIKIMCGLRHRNIVQYYGFDEKDNYLYIVLEYVSGGSLKRKLEKEGPLCELKTREYTAQILQGVKYLHQKKIIHRDIKCANILLCGATDEVKLADFGISKQLETMCISAGASTFVGSPNFMSPEAVRGDQRYGHKTDIWGLGCTVVEMLTKDPPWCRYEYHQVIFKIGLHNSPEYELPDEVSDIARDFLEKTFVIDAKDRPCVEGLLNHLFVQNLDGDENQNNINQALDPNTDEIPSTVRKIEELRFEDLGMPVDHIYNTQVVGSLVFTLLFTEGKISLLEWDLANSRHRTISSDWIKSAKYFVEVPGKKYHVVLFRDVAPHVVNFNTQTGQGHPIPDVGNLMDGYVYPQSGAVDDQGRVYILNSLTRELFVFDSNGLPLQTIAIGDHSHATFCRESKLLFTCGGGEIRKYVWSLRGHNLSLLRTVKVSNDNLNTRSYALGKDLMVIAGFLEGGLSGPNSVQFLIGKLSGSRGVELKKLHFDRVFKTRTLPKISLYENTLILATESSLIKYRFLRASNPAVR